MATTAPTRDTWMPYVIEIDSSDDEAGGLIIDRRINHWFEEGEPTPLIDFSGPDVETENENFTTGPRTSSNNPPSLPFSFTFSMPPGAPILYVFLLLEMGNVFFALLFTPGRQFSCRFVIAAPVNKRIFELVTIMNKQKTLR
uniref:Uncharacterized protein n=1 Tax=Romanomermis culicivorax TaxID=13658 RepID=A0A915K664_ROMCU